jgi:hypothetical protein
MYKASVSPGFVKQIMPYLTQPMLWRQLVTWTVVGLTAAKFKPLILFVLGFALSYIANIWINMILYDFCLLPAQFSDEIINVRNFESHM